MVEISSVLATNKCAFFYGLIVLFFLNSLILVLFKINLHSDVEIVEVVNFSFITCQRGKKCTSYELFTYCFFIAFLPDKAAKHGIRGFTTVMSKHGNDLNRADTE